MKRSSSLFSLYRDGFRNMTWGRPLVWLIVLKLVILFGILRLFFFRPAMAGLSDAQKSEQVGARLAPPQASDDNSLNLLTDR